MTSTWDSPEVRITIHYALITVLGDIGYDPITQNSPAVCITRRRAGLARARRGAPQLGEEPTHYGPEERDVYNLSLSSSSSSHYSPEERDVYVFKIPQHLLNEFVILDTET